MNTWITRVDLFKNCPEALIIQLTMAIKQQTFPPQEKILVPGDWSDKMFIVRKGVAICRQKIVTTGQVFCVESLYKEGKVAYSAHAVTFCDLYTIDRDVLMTALKHFPECAPTLQDALHPSRFLRRSDCVHGGLSRVGGIRSERGARRHHGRATSAFSEEASRTLW